MPNNKMTSDLMAGVGAAIAFLIMMLGLHFAWPIGAVLAVATYVGIKFALPAPKALAESDDSIADARASVAKLRAMVVTPPSVQLKLNDVCSKATALIAYFASDANGNVDGQVMLQQYLALLEGAVSRYSDAVKLSGGVGQESTKSITELLDGLATRFGSLHDKLAHEDDAEISNEIKALNQTLTEMDTLTLKVRGDNS